MYICARNIKKNSMKTENQKVAVVVKGYYEQKENEVFALYLIDKKSVLIIPFDNELLNEIESVECLGDTVNFLESNGYKIKYDFRKETQFDITKNLPQLINSNLC